MTDEDLKSNANTLLLIEDGLDSAIHRIKFFTSLISEEIEKLEGYSSDIDELKCCFLAASKS